jgi:hypothetical protein
MNKADIISMVLLEQPVSAKHIAKRVRTSQRKVNLEIKLIQKKSLEPGGPCKMVFFKFAGDFKKVTVGLISKMFETTVKTVVSID